MGTTEPEQALLRLFTLPKTFTLEDLVGEWTPMIREGEKFCDDTVLLSGKKAAYKRANRWCENHLFEKPSPFGPDITLDDSRDRWRAMWRSDCQIEWHRIQEPSLPAPAAKPYDRNDNSVEFTKPTNYMVWTRFSPPGFK